MKGSHTVDGFLLWLDKSDFPPMTKLNLKKRVREAANRASETNGSVDLPLKHQDKVLMVLRFFEDGSVTAGWPDDGTSLKPMFVPPPEDEI